MNYFNEKMQVTIALKRFLESKGFNEVHTPIMRRESSEIIKRIKLGNINGYLRDSHELQLRWLLTNYDSVYEIGSCFRYENDDSNTNMPEFLLMELFTSKHDLREIMDFVKEFIGSQKSNTVFEEISVAQQIKTQLGIDLSHRGAQKALYKKLREQYSSLRLGFDHDYEFVLHYIETEIEPLSKGKVVFFTDYPECTCSYANIKCGDIIERFELFADNVELANGFDDECDAKRFIARNKELPIFKTEESVIANALVEKKLPDASSGVGIGIERLCMFLFDIKDIRSLAFPTNDF